MRNYITTYDPFFDRFFLGENESKRHELMRTDIKEKKDHYELKVDLPDIKKENVKVSLDNGYLTIEAKYNNETEDDGKYIYHERVYGEFSRSYYVGKDVAIEDMDAALKDGVLTLTIKKVTKKEEEKYLSIK